MAFLNLNAWLYKSDSDKISASLGKVKVSPWQWNTRISFPRILSNILDWPLLVIRTSPHPISFFGPGYTFPPQLEAISCEPRQIPKIGIPRSKEEWINFFSSRR